MLCRSSIALRVLSAKGDEAQANATESVAANQALKRKLINLPLFHPEGVEPIAQRFELLVANINAQEIQMISKALPSKRTGLVTETGYVS
jgi:hypothetical protein